MLYNMFCNKKGRCRSTTLTEGNVMISIFERYFVTKHNYEGSSHAIKELNQPHAYNLKDIHL